MGILERIKKKGEKGFKGLVKTIETAPHDKQKEIILAGNLDDAPYMKWVEKNLLSLKKILTLTANEIQLITESVPNAEQVFPKIFQNLQTVD